VTQWKILSGWGMVVGLVLLAGCGGGYLPLVSPEVSFAPAEPQPLKVGAAALPITPNGPIFTAGAYPFRTAFTSHDDLWARVVVLDDGTHRIALVVLDLIGINYDDVVKIRNQVAQNSGANYVMVAATHTHTAPDLVGIWSPTGLHFDDFYNQFLRIQIANAVFKAETSLRPAKIRIASAPAGDPQLLRDTRPPNYIDDTLTVWQAIDSETDEVIATSIHFANHPILVPSSTFDVSSDFPHYLREAIENGMDGDDGPVNAQGGVCLYFNAAMAGRLVPDSATPLTTVPPTDPEWYSSTMAYGYRLAWRSQKILSEKSSLLTDPMAISAVTRHVQVPVENSFLRQATAMHLILRGATGGEISTEVGVVRVGPMEFFAIPGMIFPELVRSSLPLQAIDGSDFPDAVPEAPRLDQMAHQPYFIPVGLANDMLGYIIPKCLWDAEAPFTDEGAPYGEIVCPGPDTASLIIDAFHAITEAP